MSFITFGRTVHACGKTYTKSCLINLRTVVMIDQDSKYICLYFKTGEHYSVPYDNKKDAQEEFARIRRMLAMRPRSGTRRRLIL
jgi:hypothetical protein